MEKSSRYNLRRNTRMDYSQYLYDADLAKFWNDRKTKNKKINSKKSYNVIEHKHGTKKKKKKSTSLPVRRPNLLERGNSQVVTKLESAFEYVSKVNDKSQQSSSPLSIKSNNQTWNAVKKEFFTNNNDVYYDSDSGFYSDITNDGSLSNDNETTATIFSQNLENLSNQTFNPIVTKVEVKNHETKLNTSSSSLSLLDIKPLEKKLLSSGTNMKSSKELPSFLSTGGQISLTGIQIKQLVNDVVVSVTPLKLNNININDVEQDNFHQHCQEIFSSKEKKKKVSTTSTQINPSPSALNKIKKELFVEKNNSLMESTQNVNEEISNNTFSNSSNDVEKNEEPTLRRSSRIRTKINSYFSDFKGIIGEKYNKNESKSKRNTKSSISSRTLRKQRNETKNNPVSVKLEKRINKESDGEMSSFTSSSFESTLLNDGKTMNAGVCRKPANQVFLDLSKNLAEYLRPLKKYTVPDELIQSLALKMAQKMNIHPKYFKASRSWPKVFKTREFGNCTVFTRGKKIIQIIDVPDPEKKTIIKKLFFEPEGNHKKTDLKSSSSIKTKTLKVSKSTLKKQKEGLGNGSTRKSSNVLQQNTPCTEELLLPFEYHQFHAETNEIIETEQSSKMNVDLPENNSSENTFVLRENNSSEKTFDLPENNNSVDKNEKSVHHFSSKPLIDSIDGETTNSNNSSSKQPILSAFISRNRFKLGTVRLCLKNLPTVRIHLEKLTKSQLEKLSLRRSSQDSSPIPSELLNPIQERDIKIPINNNSTRRRGRPKKHKNIPTPFYSGKQWSKVFPVLKRYNQLPAKEVEKEAVNSPKQVDKENFQDNDSDEMELVPDFVDLSLDIDDDDLDWDLLNTVSPEPVKDCNLDENCQIIYEAPVNSEKSVSNIDDDDDVCEIVYEAVYDDENEDICNNKSSNDGNLIASPIRNTENPNMTMKSNEHQNVLKTCTMLSSTTNTTFEDSVTDLTTTKCELPLNSIEPSLSASITVNDLFSSDIFKSINFTVPFVRDPTCPVDEHIIEFDNILTRLRNEFNHYCVHNSMTSEDHFDLAFQYLTEQQ